MAESLLDLTKPEHAYFFGFVQGDGHLYLAHVAARKNDGRGRLAIEISERDADILKSFQKLFSFPTYISHRSRDTNFKKGYKSAVWGLHNQPLRLQIETLGMKAGRKSANIQPPQVPYSEDDYWRGMLDADGSVGEIGSGRPYISFVTVSGFMALSYLNYIRTLTGMIKTTSRNKRDGAYNILLFDENAQAVAKRLYYPGALAIKRKAKAGQKIQNWERSPDTPYVGIRNCWLPYEDNLLLRLGPKAATLELGRTINGTTIRYRRLKSGMAKTRKNILYPGMADQEVA